jgi:outer membrane lipoprotein-sorting protein
MRSPKIFALLLCAPLAFGADAALQAVFQRMDKAAVTFKGFTADLLKMEHHAIIDDNEKQSGTVAVRKAGPHSIQVLEKFLPDGEQIELDGTRVQDYHPKINTVRADDLGKKYHGLMEEVMLIAFGGNSKDLLDGYQVSLGGSEMVAGQPATRLILVAKDRQLLQTFPKVEVWYSDVTGIAVQQKWYDQGLADYTIQTYTNMKIGPVSEAQVKLVVPKDAHREHLFK